jgi:ribosomal protein L13
VLLDRASRAALQAPLHQAKIHLEQTEAGHDRVYVQPQAGRDHQVLACHRCRGRRSRTSDKFYHRHSGRPGGLTSIAAGDLLAKDPRQVVELAVWGMLPKNRLSRQLIKKLKVYAGPEHPHTAQQPQQYQITQIAQ